MYNSINDLMDALTNAGLGDCASQVANFDSIADILKMDDEDILIWADGVIGATEFDEEGRAYLSLLSPNDERFAARDAD